MYSIGLSSGRVISGLFDTNMTHGPWNHILVKLSRRQYQCKNFQTFKYKCVCFFILKQQFQLIKIGTNTIWERRHILLKTVLTTKLYSKARYRNLDVDCIVMYVPVPTTTPAPDCPNTQICLFPTYLITILIYEIISYRSPKFCPNYWIVVRQLNEASLHLVWQRKVVCSRTRR